MDQKLLRETLTQRKIQFAARKASYETLKNEHQKILSERQALEEYIEKLAKVQQLFQMTASFAREQSKVHIESMVTSCLRAVFGQEIQFIIEMQEANRRMQAQFLIEDKIDQQNYLFPPQEARGGGVVDVISLALRISFLLRTLPPMERILILDEPAKHVSEDYIHNVAELLLQIAEEFSMQIILVTHNRHLAYMGEKVYEVTADENHSHVQEITNLQETELQ